MRDESKKTPTSKLGRPVSGVTRKKISISVPSGIAAQAMKQAARSNESLSQFISRAIQNQLLS